MIDNEKKSRLYFIYLRYCEKDMKSFDEVSVEELISIIAELKEIKSDNHDSEKWMTRSAF